VIKNRFLRMTKRQPLNEPRAEAQPGLIRQAHHDAPRGLAYALVLICRPITARNSRTHQRASWSRGGLSGALLRSGLFLAALRELAARGWSARAHVFIGRISQPTYHPKNRSVLWIWMPG
jgi:hypothetical protein